MKINKSFFLLILISLFLGSCRTPKENNKKNSGHSHKKELTELEKEECLSVFLEANKEKILGNNSNAGALFAECIRKNPKDDASFYELSSILVSDKKYDDALILAKEAASLKPKNEWYQILLAEIYTQKKLPNEAAKIYEKLIKVYPERTDYYYELAMLYLSARKYNDAIRVYNQLENIIGINEELSVQKQTIYMYNRDAEKAAEEVNKLITAFPKESRYKIMLADVYMSSGQKEKASKIYDDILRDDPKNGMVNLSLADYYRSIGNNEKFYEQIKLAFSNQNVEIDSKIKILLSYFSLTDNAENKKFLNEAYELLDILIKTHPDDAIAYSIYADFLTRDKKDVQARDMFLKVIELDKNRYPVWEQLLIIESDLRNYKSLDSLSKIAIELFPEQPLLYLLKGFANYHFKNYEEAVKVLKEGLSYALFDEKLRAEFYMYLGDTYNQLKNYSESDAAYENSLKIDSTNITILNNYSYYLTLRGEKLEKAKSMSKKSNELSPDVPSYQDTYAWVLFNLKEYDEALIWIKKALAKSGSGNPVIIEHYGDILYKLNRKSEALEQWKNAKETGKGSEFLDKKIETQTLIP